MKLSIIIPAHNEEHRLPPMLEAYGAFFSEKYGDDVELIVVPNFCDDRTVEVALSVGNQFPVIKVLEDPGYVGKGGAVVLGAEAASGDLVGFVDADGATSPEAFDDLVEKIGDAGCIIASRWMKGSVMSPKQPLSRRIASRCFNTLVRVLFGLRLNDTQCGAKLFRREVVEPVVCNLGVTKWAFDVDMLFQASRLGASIKEIPTVWNDVAGSKVKIGRSSVQMLVAMVRLRMFYSPLRFMIPYVSRVVERLVRYKR
ncbi:dolichyl-phosphate beta-glucosyltransferase [Tichowtungia aerotolerans]|uniref:dolichyl-phosphate beta-glucosyltransferase n=1 Tax=Tichowtungia aerotolerans TaxID=2697043 RepID=A0A6P1M0J0_9BACT|nr:dolichyl-phosphate beta-glucosyltransferase [Tichowtungia aerotolerans]QHI68070.1 glycosyltransferase [Tichowtungia aerotolerans]